ncbi:right-handed parallel beta-helix repeat-containing protein [Enterobacter cloacae complex sp. CARB60]|uniref:right-handed parallel beta-helix repeat-containing protein n=1 Tax=Enterobacter cloacae complex sp. CARB60 TaxID=3119569 RepID=UPI002F412407
MSISDTLKAQKYASIAEVAAAQSKLYADKLEAAPDYAAQAAASASLAATSASQAESASLTAISAANSATASAISASNSAEAAGEAAADAIQNYIDQSVRVPGSETINPVPVAASRANAVFLWDGASQPTGKLLSEFATLDGTGKIPVSMIPSIALTEPFVVSSQAAMLALNAQVGDIAKRTDLGYSFCLASLPPSTLANWVQLTDDVLAQLGLSSGATMVGAVDDSSNPTTVQGALNLKTSIASLAASTGATLIGATNNAGATSTVQSVLNLKLEKTELAATDGEKFIGICPSIATLRSTEPTSNGQRITLREHTVGTGKGGGQFRAVLSGSSYTDNNGTIIKTSGGAAWLRINSEITNPLMFGAQATVGVDDSSAINAAIAATITECDGLGYSYQIASTIAISQPSKRFRKARISLTSTASVSTVMLRMRANYSEIIDCVFDGNGGANTSAAIIWEGALCQSGGVVRNCQFLYCGANGISVSGDYTNSLFNDGGVIQDCFFNTCGSTNPNDNRRCSILADGVSNFRIQGCDIRKSNWGIYVRQDTSLAGRPRKSGNKILDCHVEGSGRTHPTYTVAQGLSANRQEGMIVNNVRVHDFADNGFDFGSSRDCQISNAYFNSVKDAIFIGDISCERYNISNVIAESCDRGLRVVMDGTIYPTETAQQIRISNMQVFDPIYIGFSIVNTGATTVVKDIELVNCNVDSTNSWSLSTYTQAYRIVGCQFIELLNCSANVNKQAAIYIKASELVSVRGGIFRSSAKDGTSSYAITVENDSNRVSISDTMMFGESTAGAVLLAGGSGHSVKHTRWRSMTGGVSSSGATSPYLLDNIAF